MAYSIRLSVPIAAPVDRVWRALCAPAEVVQWDSGVTEAIDAPPDYPKPGQHVRWRFRAGLFRLLHDRPVEVIANRRLRSRLSLGPYDMDETYELSEATAACLLELRVEMSCHIPLLGAMLLRAHGGPETRAGFEASLAGLKRHCEATT